MGSRKITTGAGGWGLLGTLRRQFWLRKRAVLQRENEGFIRVDDPGSGRVSDRVPGRLPEVLRRAFGTSGVVEKLSKLTNLVFSRVGKEGSAYIEPTREKGFFAKLREREQRF